MTFPQDYNRRPKKEREPLDLTVWPKDLTWAYWVFVAAAVVMVVSALAGFFAQDSSTGALSDFLRSNRMFVAWANLIGALIIAFVAPQLARPMKHARSILAAVTGLSAFFNIAAVAIGAGGLFLIVIVILLVAGTYLMYRPDPNEFVRERTRPTL